MQEAGTKNTVFMICPSPRESGLPHFLRVHGRLIPGPGPFLSPYVQGPLLLPPRMSRIIRTGKARVSVVNGYPPQAFSPPGQMEEARRPHRFSGCPRIKKGIRSGRPLRPLSPHEERWQRGVPGNPQPSGWFYQRSLNKNRPGHTCLKPPARAGSAALGSGVQTHRQ